MVYVFLAHGFEEVEALAVVDFLRRCDVEVKTVGIGTKGVMGSHSIGVFADLQEDEAVFRKDLQAIVLPGGMPGTLNLERSAFVQSAIDFAVKENLLIAAICAAPSILGHKMLLQGKQAVCFPGYEDELFGAQVLPQSVCEDGNIITGNGAGAVFKFAYAIGVRLAGKEKADAVYEGMQCK